MCVWPVFVPTACIKQLRSFPPTTVDWEFEGVLFVWLECGANDDEEEEMGGSGFPSLLDILLCLAAARVMFEKEGAIKKDD